MSTSGGAVFTYADFEVGDLLSWSSRKQIITARSSAESELVAASEHSCEITGMQQNYSDLGLNSSHPIPIRLDSQACLDIIANPINHKKNKHIQYRYFHIRELQSRKIIKPSWISTKEMIADIFTKPLPAADFLKFRKYLVHDIDSAALTDDSSAT